MSSMPKYAMTYVVYWPDHGVLKVGRAWRFQRVQMMVRSGGHIVVLARGTDATWEAEALRVMRRWFPAAFAREADAHGLLFMGRGWTECFKVDEHHLQLAVDLCFEGFARGNDQGVNEAEDDQRDGSRVQGLPASAGRREADSDGAVAAHRRRRPPRVGAGTHRGGPVSGPRRDGDDRGASADARRVRVPQHLLGRGLGMDRARTAAEGRSPRRVIGMPATARPGSSTEVRGCGGSARAGGREGADRAGRAGRAGRAVGDVGGRAGASAPAAGTTSAAGCSAHRMPGSPARQVRQLRSLWNCQETSRSMGPGGQVRRADDRVRAGQGERREQRGGVG